MFSVFKNRKKEGEKLKLINDVGCVGKFPAHIEFIKIGGNTALLQRYDKMLALCHKEKLNHSHLNKGSRARQFCATSFFPDELEVVSLVESCDKSDREYPFLVYGRSMNSLVMTMKNMSSLLVKPYFDALNTLYNNGVAMTDLPLLIDYMNQLLVINSAENKASLLQKTLDYLKQWKVNEIFKQSPLEFHCASKTIDGSINGSLDEIKQHLNDKGVVGFGLKAGVLETVLAFFSQLQSMCGSFEQVSLVWELNNLAVSRVYFVSSNQVMKTLINLYSGNDTKYSMVNFELFNDKTLFDLINEMSHSVVVS